MVGSSIRADDFFTFSYFRRKQLQVILSLSGSQPGEGPLSNEEYRSYFEMYFGAIRNFLYFKTSDEGMAEDIAQDTFIKLWENRHKIQRKTVKSYLYTIAGNLAINQLKRQQLQYKFMNQVEYHQDNKDPDYLLRMKEFEAELQAVIASMPEGSREVFLMNRIEDLKYREIAERIGITVKAVEKRMSKALQIIREKMNIEV